MNICEQYLASRSSPPAHKEQRETAKNSATLAVIRPLCGPNSRISAENELAAAVKFREKQREQRDSGLTRGWLNLSLIVRHFARHTGSRFRLPPLLRAQTLSRRARFP